MNLSNCLLVIVLLFSLLQISVCKKNEKKKNPRDYTDVDIHALDEQWMEDDDIEEGDLPEHKRPQKPVDFSKMNMENPEELLKATKRHKTLMMFATISGNPSREETEEISGLWQSQLSNGHLKTERYVISDNRILIKIEDGSYAFEIKNFLVNQERCELVTLEGKDYPGKGSKNNKKNSKKMKKKSKKSEKGKKKSEL